MRAAIFTDTYLPEVNGVAKTLERWATYLEAHGVETILFAPSGEQSGSGEPTANASYTVERFFSIPFVLYPECKMALPNVPQIGRTLKEFQPSIIHVATPFNIGLCGRFYARKYGVPLVGSYHTHFDQYLAYYKLQWMEPMVRKYMSWFYSDCHKVYVPSPSAMNHLAPRGIRNMEVWSRGIDAAAFRPGADRRDAVLQRYDIPRGKFIVLYVGRLALEKSVDVLLHAFERVPASAREHMELVIAGDGPLYKELSAKYGPAAGLGGQTNVRLLGYVHGTALSELYAAADVLLFPSSTETFGNVVLESLACGTPVIGANAGGVKDNVRHGRTGLLCPPGDAGAFADALLTLYENAELRSRLSAAGREYALSQSWDRIFAGLLASYRQVLQQSAQEKALIV
jgi:glycosyltransferase involved in cell wall biosynthesis